MQYQPGRSSATLAAPIPSFLGATDAAALLGYRSTIRPSSVTITVHPDDTTCSVHESDMRCSDVPTFLLQTLHVTLDQKLMVTWRGADPTETLGRNLAARLRDAGFNNIVLMGFLTEPDHGVRDMTAPANQRLERP